jgi:hypothetical protein
MHLPNMIDFRIIIEILIALPQQRKVMAMQVHRVRGGDENPVTVGRDLVRRGNDQPDPGVVVLVIQRDDIEMGLFDEGIEAV